MLGSAASKILRCVRAQKGLHWRKTFLYFPTIFTMWWSLRTRDGVEDKIEQLGVSSPESDRYEELLVNRTLGIELVADVMASAIDSRHE